MSGYAIRRNGKHIQRIISRYAGRNFVTDLEGIAVVTRPSKSFLNERQLVDYRSHREACLTWLRTFGKDPDKIEGYGP